MACMCPLKRWGGNACRNLENTMNHYIQSTVQGLSKFRPYNREGVTSSHYLTSNYL
jgi:hypothetical protein